MQFDLSPLIGARAGKHLTFSLEEGPQRLDDIHIAFLRGEVRFTRVQNGILVEAELQTQVEVECIRCLEQFSYPTGLEVEETIGLAGRPHPDIIYYLTEEGWINLTPILREQVWVTLPMKPLCRSDCLGLCAQCGGNLSLEPCRCHEERIDPRMAVLKELRK